MISEKITMKSCVGKLVKTDRDLQNGFARIPAGTKAKITGTSWAGFTILSEKCPHCGIQIYMSHVKRKDLTLIGGEEK